jgi:hypothetical protein
MRPPMPSSAGFESDVRWPGMAFARSGLALERWVVFRRVMIDLRLKKACYP